MIVKKAVFIIGMLLCLGTGKAQSWSNSMYEEYTYKSFVKYPPANKFIDLNNIDYALLNAAVFYASNEVRKKKGRKLFKHSARLAHAAFEHSKDMRVKKFFSHTSKIRGKEDLTDRLNLVGYKWGQCAENIAKTFGIQLKESKGYFTPAQNGGYFSYKHKGKPIPNHTYLSFAEQVVDGWMHSKGHRENLLNKAYTHLGCGSYLDRWENKNRVPYILSTQNFAAPQDE